MSRGKKVIKPAMTKREARRSIKELYWADQIETYRNSGQSAIQWCQENNVNIHTMTSWITKLNMQQRKSRNRVDDEALVDQPQSSGQQGDRPNDARIDDAGLIDAVAIDASVTPPPQQLVMCDDQPRSHSVVSQAQPSMNTPVSLANTDRQKLVIQHDGITISAEPGYKKDKMMALLQVLLNSPDQN